MRFCAPRLVTSQETDPLMLEGRHAILGACALVLLQAITIWTSRGQTGAALLSDLVQLLLGILCVVESIRALRLSASAWRFYWLWMAVTFGVWAGAQALGLTSIRPPVTFLSRWTMVFSSCPESRWNAALP